LANCDLVGYRCADASNRLCIGSIDFNDKKKVLVPADATHKVAEVAIRYGTFINTLIDFIIIAFCIFMVVKAVNSLKKPVEAPPAADPEPTKEELLLTEIRDLLAKGK